MASDIISGSTKKYLIRLKDRDTGLQLDPSDPQVLNEAKVIIYNGLSGTVIGRFYLNEDPAPNTGWVQMQVVQIAAGDKRIRFILTPAMTTAGIGKNIMIQATIHYVDPDCEGSVRIDIKKGRFVEIEKAVA